MKFRTPALVLLLVLLFSTRHGTSTALKAAPTTRAAVSATGPGGVGDALSLWLKADAITNVSSGNPVSVWPDSSGNGFDLSLLFNNSRPTWQENVLNGMFPVVAFDGTDDVLAESSGTPRDTNFTGIVVSSLSGVSDSDGIFLSSPGSPNAVDFKLRTLGSCAGQYVLSAEILGMTEELCGGGISFVGPSLLSYRYDAGLAESWKNGAFVSSINVSSSWVPDLGQYTVGVDRSQSNFFSGNIAELVIYTGVLNSAQRRIVENYLAAKYDLSLAAGDVYAGDTAGNGDFDLDVAGIGREADGEHLEAASAGLVLSATAQQLGVGDYLMAGHRAPTNFINTAALPAGVEARWYREWFVDGNGQTVTLTFNKVEAGVSYLGGDYKLLFRANDAAAHIVLAATPVVNGDDVSFTLAPGDGLYTLGIGDIDPTTIGAIQVNSTADIPPNNVDGLCTLREAIDAANDDATSGSVVGECFAGSGADTIFLPAGVYTLELAGPGEDFNVSGDLDIRESVRILGDGAETTIIQGAATAGTATDRVIDIPLASDVTLADLTIRYGVAPHQSAGNGQPGANGGGINNTGNLELRQVHLIQNRAGDGSRGFVRVSGGAGGAGGAIFSSGVMTVTRSLLDGNQAGNGGAGSNGESGSLGGCQDTARPGGDGGNGGGIAVVGFGTLWLGESTVANNQTGDGGDGGDGTFYCSGANAGDGGDGGGIFGDQSAIIRAFNSTLSGNGAGNGGIGGSNSSLTPAAGDGGRGGDGGAFSLGSASNNGILRSLTLYGNTAGLGGPSGGGGGLGGAHGVAALDAGSGAISLQNSIVTASTPTDCNGTISGSNNLVNSFGSGACAGVSSAAVTNLDSVLADNGGPTPTHALASDSNAVDAGEASCPDPGGTPLAADQRGTTRPYGQACDIGAYEYLVVETVDDAYQVPLNSLLSVPAPGVLGNDPGYVAGVTVVGTGGSFAPTDNGLLNLADDGGFSYYPNPDFVGDDVIAVTLTDGGNFGSSVMTITVISTQNASIVAVDDVYAVLEDNELTVADPGVLGNDISDSSLTAGLVNDVSSGTLALSPTGGFTYSPTLNFYGVMSFTYRMTDTIGQTDEAIAYILVSPVNDPPQVAADGFLVEADSTLVSTAGVLANDVDPEGNDMLATLVTDVAVGTLSLNLDGSFSYTPPTGFSGVVSFTYEATDGEDTAQAVANLYVDAFQFTLTGGIDIFSWLPGLELYGSATPYDGFAFLDDDGDYVDFSGETRYYQLRDPESGVLKWFGVFRFGVSPGGVR